MSLLLHYISEQLNLLIGSAPGGSAQTRCYSHRGLEIDKGPVCAKLPSMDQLNTLIVTWPGVVVSFDIKYPPAVQTTGKVPPPPPPTHTHPTQSRMGMISLKMYLLHPPFSHSDNVFQRLGLCPPESSVDDDRAVPVGGAPRFLPLCHRYGSR